jgi:hypothetical protein
MTYSTGSLIAAADFNSFATSINSVWGLGTGDSGYGCTNTVSSVTAAVDTATATQWTTLLARGNSSASHQGTSWTAGSSVSAGNTISVISTLSSNITSITNNRLTTTAGGLTSAAQTQASNATSWTTSKTFTFTVAFTGGTTNIDAARHYFNAGGKIQIAYGHSGGTGTKNTDWDSLCTASGTTVFAYGGTTKSGGSGSTNILATTTGYYQLLTTNTAVFKQFSANAPYTSNYVQFDVKTDTTTDANGRGGKGSTLTFLVTFADAYSDTYTAPAGTWTVDVTLVRPNTTYLNNIPTATYTAGSWTNA